MESGKGKKVLIIGAGGFAGGFYVEEGLRRGYEVWAGVRASTSRKYLTDPNIHFVVFDFDKPEEYASVLDSALPEGEKWDYIIYNLGATKVLSYADFNRINYEYLRDFIQALQNTGKRPDKFLYISSLSAVGPKDEKGYSSYTEEMIPQPNTRYGASKLKAEMLLQMSGLPYIIFRATGIYGPRDHDYFLMFKSIKEGFDFGVGYRRQMLSFIYVEDLSRAAYDALEKSPVNELYNIAEGKNYTQKEFRTITSRLLKRSVVIPVKLPLWAVKGVSAIAEKIGVIRGKASTLNSDKFNIMKQRNWSADISKARKSFGFHPEVSLEEGVGRSLRWYKENGWL